MSFPRPSLHAIAFETCRDIIVLQTCRIKHFLETGERTLVPIPASVPETFQRRNLVIAGPFPCLERKTRVRAHAYGKDVQELEMLFRRREPGGERQLVVGVERRRVASGAVLPLEDLLAGRGSLVELLRAQWRLEGIDVAGERIQRLVRQPRGNLP